MDEVDNNKFVDYAIASSADFIVSNENGFTKLASIPFPPVTVLKYIESEESYKFLILDS